MPVALGIREYHAELGRLAIDRWGEICFNTDWNKGPLAATRIAIVIKHDRVASLIGNDESPVPRPSFNARILVPFLEAGTPFINHQIDIRPCCSVRDEYVGRLTRLQALGFKANLRPDQGVSYVASDKCDLT